MGVRVLRGVVLFVFLVVTATCWADPLVVVTDRTRLGSSDSANWSLFGSPYTDVVSGSSIDSQSGIVVTVSQPEYGLQIMQQQNGYFGDFFPGETLLTNWNSPFPITISFSRPIFGAGVNLEPAQVQDLPAQFSAFVTAYDGNVWLGQFSTTGTKTTAMNGTAPFLGVLSDQANITSLTYRVAVQTNGPSTGDFAMDSISLKTENPVPETSSIAFCLTGLALLSVLARVDSIACWILPTPRQHSAAIE